MGIERISKQSLEKIATGLGIEVFEDTPPKPKYRPMTPVEAASHLGRFFNTPHNILPLDTVTKNQLGTEGMMRSYAAFITFTWADTGEPCGIKED